MSTLTQTPGTAQAAGLQPMTAPAPLAADAERALATDTRTLPLRGPLLACAVLLGIFTALGLAFGFLHLLYTPRRAAIVASALLLVHR